MTWTARPVTQYNRIVSVRLQWTVVILIAALLVAVLLAAAVALSRPKTGSVRAVIGAGSTHKLVDVALIDSTGQEYAGNNRSAGQSETLPLIPAGAVQVNVGTCSKPAVVQPNRTVVVAFDPAECIR